MNKCYTDLNQMVKTKDAQSIKAPLVPFILIISLFFMWGLANNLTDTLLAAFKRILSLSDFQTSWVQIAFYGGYFCLALPAAVFIKKFTYKSGVLLGLGMYILGALLFYPSSMIMQYGFFLVSLYILAGGLAILETTCNPYVMSMGPEEGSTQRLNLAQSFNPIGSISGVIISKFYILSELNLSNAQERAAMAMENLGTIQKAELNAVMGPYVILGFILLSIWLLIAFTKMPKTSMNEKTIDLLPTVNRLLSRKNYVWGIITQFFYVGAQICVWSFTIRYVMIELKLNEATASNYYIAALVVFTVFRFVNTFLMKYFKPSTLLTFSAVFGIISTFIVIIGSGYLGVIALVAISGFMSLMFPTIFGLASKGLGKDQKIGSSGLIMAIGGGAFLPALQGAISDMTGSIHISYTVPLICFIIVALYGFLNQRINFTSVTK